MSEKPARRRRLAWLPLLSLFFIARVAAAQAEPPPVQRDVDLSWDTDRGLLYLDIGFRDVIDAGIRNKLSRGLPTTIVLTAVFTTLTYATIYVGAGASFGDVARR